MSRLFVAVVPPAEIVAELAAAVVAVRDQAPGLRWSPPQLWHLTLAFLGPVPEVVALELPRQLAAVAAQREPVPAAVAGAGQFGRRVLWLGVVDDTTTPGPQPQAHLPSAVVGPAAPARQAPSTRLAALAKDVRLAAEGAGVTGLDTRPWQPHLTLARVPEGATTDLAPLVEGLNRLHVPRWEVNEIRLLRGEAGAMPTYPTVNSWRLTGRSPSTDHPSTGH